MKTITTHYELSCFESVEINWANFYLKPRTHSLECTAVDRLLEKDQRDELLKGASARQLQPFHHGDERPARNSLRSI